MKSAVEFMSNPATPTARKQALVGLAHSIVPNMQNLSCIAHVVKAIMLTTSEVELVLVFDIVAVDNGMYQE